jgi:hypothetical protein
LKERRNRVAIERDHVPPSASPKPLDQNTSELVGMAIESVAKARKRKRPVILAFGAHTIKNGLGPVIIDLLRGNWITHLATNGAGIIHDWEFAFQGESSENVKANIHEGKFGMWEETGYYLNLALSVGAYEGLGYGESIGSFIEREKLAIPERAELEDLIRNSSRGDWSKVAAAADLLRVIEAFDIQAGTHPVDHPFKAYSIQGNAFRMGVPCTGHPMFGHDIIYTHPMNQGSAVGRTAERDFLRFAGSVANIEDGVYISIGSAVMSPMIFEKAFSMAQNLSQQQGQRISRHRIVVVDLAESDWDWQRDGEPPEDDPSYYIRYCKTFSRVGGHMNYITADNRDFLLRLHHGLTDLSVGNPTI